MQDPNNPPQFPQQPQVPGQYMPQGMQPQNNQNALISLICMIVSWVVIPVIPAIVAIILGRKAQQEIAMSNGMQSGAGMAKAGVIGGWINIGFWVLFMLCFCGIFAMGGLASLQNVR